MEQVDKNSKEKTEQTKQKIPTALQSVLCLSYAWFQFLLKYDELYEKNETPSYSLDKVIKK